MRDRAFADMDDEFHIAVRMRRKTSVRGDRAVVSAGATVLVPVAAPDHPLSRLVEIPPSAGRGRSGAQCDGRYLKSMSVRV